MKKTTKILLLALAVMMLTLVMSISAFAEEIEVNDSTGLESALSNAKSGDEIVLTSDIKDAGVLTIKAGVTLNGNGNKITGNTRLVLASDGEVTVKNVYFQNIDDGTTSELSAITSTMEDATSITITGCTFENIDYDSMQFTTTGVVNGATIVITNNTFLDHTSTEFEGYRHVHIEPKKLAGQALNVTITGNKFYGTADSNMRNLTLYYLDEEKSQVTVSGNYFYSTYYIAFAFYDGAKSYAAPKEYLLPMMDESLKNEKELAAYFTYGNYNVGYTDDLSEAINKSYDSVVLLNDVTASETLTIPQGKVVTLDLNGKTISQIKECTGSYSLIDNKGSLTITGNGKISFTDTGAGDSSFGWGTYTICNNGTLVVENGTIENLSQQNSSTSIVSMYCAISQHSGSTIINGGTISTPTYRSVRLLKGDMTINGGVFEGQVWVQADHNTSSLTIKGGTFAPRGADGSSVFVENVKTVSFSVEGGSFTTKIGCSNAEAIAGAITGGTFTASAKAYTNEALIGSSFEFVENADGTYGVEASLENIFTFIGYSIREDGTGITAGFKVDQKALAIYEEANGVKVEYGSYFTLDSMSNNAIKDSLVENRTGTYNLTIKGVTAEAYGDLALIMTMYVTDGETTEYVSSLSGLGGAENVTTITYNEIKGGKE